MAYFPFFVDIEGKSVLIVGGGTVALRKVGKMHPFQPSITVVAPCICDEIRAFPDVCCVEGEFLTAMLDSADYVIAATNNRELNHEISKACKERNILVNVVDCKPECTFLFPSLIKQGDLSIGISTSGASPSAAIWIKEQISGILPDNFGEILEYLELCRPLVKKEFGTESARSLVFKAVFARCIQEQRIPTDAELQAIIEEVKKYG